MFRLTAFRPAAALARAASTAPAAPAAKRPLNGYMRFAAAKRAEVLAAQPPGTKVTEVAKIIGGMWRALTAEAKETWKKA